MPAKKPLTLPLTNMNDTVSSCGRIPDKVETSSGEGNRKDACTKTQLEKPPLKTSASAANSPTDLVNSATSGPVPSTEEVNEKGAEEDNKEFVIPERYTRSGRKKAIPFTLKLMKVLSMKEFSDILTWVPDGKSFVIMNPKEFTLKVLPIYFKDAKFSSFTRKLHRWGFQRHLRGDESGAFFHKNFQKGRLDLADTMTCYQPKSTKKNVVQQASSMTASHPSSSLAVSQFPPKLSRHEMAEIAQLQAQASRGLTDHYGAMHDDVSTFDIAVELEVTRRLRERVTSAVTSGRILGAAEFERRPAPSTTHAIGFPSQQPREYYEYDVTRRSSSISRDLHGDRRSRFGVIPCTTQRGGIVDDSRNMYEMSSAYRTGNLVPPESLATAQFGRTRDLLSMPSSSATPYGRECLGASSQASQVGTAGYGLPLTSMGVSIPHNVTSRPAEYGGVLSSTTSQEYPCSTRLGMGGYDQPLSLLPMNNVAHAKTA